MNHNKTHQNPTAMELLPNIEGLKPKQIQALSLITAGTSITDTAKAIEVNRSTVYDWFNLPTFQAAYNLLLEQAQQEVKIGMLGLYLKALKTVSRCLESDNINIAQKTAIMVLDSIRYAPIGETDPRTMIEVESTFSGYSTQSQTVEEEFDAEYYEERCKELGITPYPEE